MGIWFIESDTVLRHPDLLISVLRLIASRTVAGSLVAVGLLDLVLQTGSFSAVKANCGRLPVVAACAFLLPTLSL